MFTPTKPPCDIRVDEPAEVKEAGTGFMLIKRHVLSGTCSSSPGENPEWFDCDRGGQEVAQFFQAEIEPEWRRYEELAQRIGLR